LRGGTYIRESANDVQKAALELASEALEFGAPVDMVGLEVLELAQDKLEDIIVCPLLEFDDVLVGDDLCTSPSGKDWRTLVERLSGGRG
jgi:hypothetical protein